MEGENASQAAQTHVHVAREGCNVIYIPWRRAGVGRTFPRVAGGG